MEKVFNKLVRDNIPNIIENNGEKTVTRILEDNEYKEELLKKLVEETNEVINADSSNALLEEIADVYEVLESIVKLENKEMKDVIEIANAKREKRGGFDKRIFLEKTF